MQSDASSGIGPGGKGFSGNLYLCLGLEQFRLHLAMAFIGLVWWWRIGTMFLAGEVVTDVKRYALSLQFGSQTRYAYARAATVAQFGGSLTDVGLFTNMVATREYAL